MRRHFAAGYGLALVLLSACAQDPEMLRWERGLQAATRLADGDAEAAGRAMDAYRLLERTALKPVDRQLLVMRRARLHARQGRIDRAMALYQQVALKGLRRMDRARAAYEMARILEEQGKQAQALAAYRRLALTYPSLMPGLRGLAHTERLLYRMGPAGVDAHLNWMHQHYPVMRYTELGDNFLYAAAVVGRKRARAMPEESSERTALLKATEVIYRRIHEEHYRKGLWMQSVWELSYLLEGQGRWAAAMVEIRKILKTKETGGLFGDSLHHYFRVGRWRIARMHQQHLKDSNAAAAELEAFLAEQPMSRFRDDARFYLGCLRAQAGDMGEAQAQWAEIANEYDASKFLRRVPKVVGAPKSPICDLPLLEEDKL